MDRTRFVVFLVLSLLIWAGYIGLRVLFVPDPPPVAQAPVDAEKQPEDEADATAEKPANDDAKTPAESGAATESPSSSEGTASVKVPGTGESSDKPANPQRRLTLGSLDAASNYRMLVTLNSRGASVERVELSDKYYDLEDKTGYLGELYLTESDEGLRVGLVGPGTPAALARPLAGSSTVGLQKGDIIEAIGGKPVESDSDVAEFLKKTRPEQKIEIDVARAGDNGTSNVSYEVTLVRKPLEMIRPENPTNNSPNGGTEPGPLSPAAMLMTFETIGSKTLKAQEKEFRNLPSLLTSEWKVEDEGPDFVAFSFEVDAPALDKEGETVPLKVIKRYTLKQAEGEANPGYALDLQIEIQNRGQQARQIAYRLDGPNGLPLEGWWYSVKLHPEMFKGAGARDAVYRLPGEDYVLYGCPAIVSEARTAIKNNQPVEITLFSGGEPRPIDFAGVDCQFFSSVVKPQPMSGDKPILFSRLSTLPLQDVALLDKARNKTCNVTVRMVTRSERLEPEGALSHNYQIFLGPKDPNVLNQYGIVELIEYGWWYAAYPAQILRGVLTFLHRIIGNYGIAIILLTVIVRSCMIPFSLKQAKSAALMQQLAPEMTKIKEKYADDMEKQGKAMRELYAKHNFNPFGGCLLLLFQLPVFVGLYRCLSVDIDLRDAPLFPGLAWASNLAGPDMLWYWREFIPIAMITDEAHGWLGPYFNLLPLFTIGLFILQQKMFTPPATDDQTRMQQTMMTYMTVFMGIMFYKVPAGLCLYFITSSLWSVVERKLITRPKPGAAAVTTPSASTSPTPSKPSSNGSSTTSSKPAKKQKQKRR